MAQPGTLSNTNKVPVWVVYNDVALGYTEPGDITLTITQDWTDQTFHQTGSYLMDAYLKGHRATVQCSLSETENVDMWEVAFAGGEEQNDTSSPPLERFALGDKVEQALGYFIGRKASTGAKELKLIPVSQYTTASTHTGDDIVIPKAWCRSVGDIVYSIDNNVALPCTFEAIFDPTDSTGMGLLFRGILTGTWTAV